MIYEFYCDSCKITSGVYRLVSECSLPENCTICNQPMKRIYSVPHVSIPASGYNYGLGCNQRDVKDHLRKHNDSTGDTLVEVGTENIKADKKPYDYSVESEKARQILGT